MGHYTNNLIATVKEPESISLSANPNYVTICKKNDSNLSANKQQIKFNVKYKDSKLFPMNPPKGIVYRIKFKIIETYTKIEHTFTATSKEEEIATDTFNLHKSNAITAQNMYRCFMKTPFLRDNFEMTIPLQNDQGLITDGTTIILEPKGIGKFYSFKVEASNEALSNLLFNLFFEVNPTVFKSDYNDSIMGDKSDAEIELEIYETQNVRTGEIIEPDKIQDKLITTLSKAYSGDPLWFDVNTISQKRFSNEFLSATSWCNAGTASSYRLVAKRHDGINTEPFYYSDVYHLITGYARNLEKDSLKIQQNEMPCYIYNTKKAAQVRPLTHRPLILPHIKGQRQYFNFILSSDYWGKEEVKNPEKYQLNILYRIYSQSGQHITDIQKHTLSRKDCKIVNTICLDIDNTIEAYQKAEMIEVYLAKGNVPYSLPLKFKLLPNCLYKVNDFAFLNSLGGWDSFNFGNIEQTEFKTTTETIHQTQTPDFKISSSIETVYRKEIEEEFTVQTMPVTKEIADWLKEMSASPAVYELSTKRYIIVNEVTIKHSSKDELVRVDMKYRYSDSFNTELQSK